MIPKVRQGVLDLGTWNLFTDGSVNLNGEWEFYWNRFIEPARFYQINPPVPDGYIKVPSPWNGFIYNDQAIGGVGFSTYRTKIISGNFPAVVTFEIGVLSTGYVMYINGNEVASAGRIGKNKDEMVAEYCPHIVSYTPEADELDVVIQVSNFYHSKGGLWSHVSIGAKSFVQSDHNFSNALFLIVAGSLIVIGLYHLAMYSINRYTHSPFFLGVLSILLGIRTLITGDMTIYYFVSSIPWELLVRAEYLTVVIGMPVFVLYQYNLFRERFNKTVLYAILGVGGLYTIIILFTSAYFFTFVLNYYLFITAFFIVYTFIVSTRAIIHKDEGAWGFMIAYIILMLAFINDALNAMDIIITGYYSSIGVLALIITQAISLSVKLAEAFKTVDRQNIELKHHREQLEDLIKDRTKELEKANCRLKQLSTIDALTQIPNRRRLDEYIDVEWTRLKREKQPMAIIICDIDYFKKYNDKYGHQQGDDCLEKVAKALKNSIHRPADLVARYGGEEFCAVLPNTPKVGAEKIAEEMRRNVQALKIPHEKSDVSKYVSISAGVAVMVPIDNRKAAELIELADQSLYDAKGSGRNCVSCIAIDNNQ